MKAPFLNNSIALCIIAFTFCEELPNETELFTYIFSAMFSLRLQKQPLAFFPVKKGVLRNFAKFTGKHVPESLF